MTTADDIDRAELRRLHAAATPGPWEASGGYVEQPAEFDLHRFDVMPLVICRAEERDADAEFVAAARTAVPALLDALEQAEARIKAVRDELALWDAAPTGQVMPVNGAASLIRPALDA